MWQIATYDIKPRLNRLSGVASVIIQGGQQPEFQITPDPSKMLRAHVAVQDILDTATHSNIVDSPGLLARNHQLFLGLLIRRSSVDVDQIGDMVIKNVSDTPVRIRDVGTVTPSSSAPVYTVVTANAKPAVLISINRQPDSNTVEVANEVHQQIDALRSSLPAGVELNVFYDQSNIVRESIGSVARRDSIGLILSGVIIWLFLWIGHRPGHRPRCSGDHPGDVFSDEDHGPDLQHDDPGAWRQPAAWWWTPRLWWSRTSFCTGTAAKGRSKRSAARSRN